MSVASYTVVGTSCSHCAAAVTEELRALDGVRDVRIEPQTGTVVVTSDAPLPVADVAKAVDEAGYELAATHA
jgi:copper chaperone